MFTNTESINATSEGEVNSKMPNVEGEVIEQTYRPIIIFIIWYEYLRAKTLGEAVKSIY